MILYTIGFTKRTAEQFFEPIRNNGILLLIDIRLNNNSQLAGFTKGKDLSYFLDKICKCEYVHNMDLSPTKEILDDYKSGVISWDEYAVRFAALMKQRKEISSFENKYSVHEKICLLCSEPTPEHCHRRLVAEALVRQNPTWEIIHL